MVRPECCNGQCRGCPVGNKVWSREKTVLLERQCVSVCASCLVVLSSWRGSGALVMVLLDAASSKGHDDNNDSVVTSLNHHGGPTQHCNDGHHWQHHYSNGYRGGFNQSCIG